MLSRSPPETRIQRMVRRAEEIASSPDHGYSQKPPSGRWGPDFDCSSLMYEIADYAGYPVGTGKGKVRFTGTMLKDFEKAGFQILPFANVGISDLKIGDILLNLALHAEVYVGNGESIGALASETGEYVGEAGDQTGNEIEKHPVVTFNKEWDYVLRPPEDDENDEIEEEGEEEMPMNYGPNGMMPTQPWNTTNQPWGNPPSANWNTGYPQGGNMQGYGNNRMMPNQGQPMQGYQQGYQQGYNGYPQGNLGQMNGYSQANAGYPQVSGMQGYQQGNMPSGPQGMTEDLCFVMGIEGAKNLQGNPGSRKAVFDEDKAIMYIVSFGQQGTVDNINVFQFEECSEDMPQHLSPLMRNNQNGSMTSQMGDVVTRAEFEALKEMISNESSAKRNGSTGSNGSRNPNQSGSKLNARTN